MRPLGIRAVRGLLALALAIGVGAVLTATNTLPTTRAGQSAEAIAANSLKPGACGGISLSDRAVGSGSFSGTGASELVIGSGGADTIAALGGSDCVLGGGGDDEIDGGAGADVCLGGAGTDTFIDCETEIQ